jgi:N-methylhydantoinase A
MLKGHRDSYLPEEGGFRACPIYDRYRLVPGNVVHGPAVIEERESSLVLFPGNTGQVDEHLNIMVTVFPSESPRGEGVTER